MGLDFDPTSALRAELLQLEKTRALLRRRPEILARLAGFVGLWGPGGVWREMRLLRKRAIPVARGRAKAKNLAAALARAEELLLDPEVAVLLTYGGLRSPIRGVSPLEAVAAIRREAESILAVKGSRKAGHPLDPERERLARGIARVMAESGEPPTRGRDGLYAAVLTCVLSAARDPPPGDLFRLVKRAVDSL